MWGYYRILYISCTSVIKKKIKGMILQMSRRVFVLGGRRETGKWGTTEITGHLSHVA